ncbi:zinc ABC transporter substrate-binding protein [Erysipelothrix rhusiopathiae]|uniref:metal ABC transporter substrate-binding protein n=1 Tax=Erysipelothrix rhusiopathiae TaxID=1648 RepID=UPI001EDF84FE|nr:zinc ABC transporter substrate-binding protein [Erysipelothrix rhusiopathiae]MCG4436124.1 zinc ABC transporter substrate-binding protein [Erysipelothrix rhusiopathiae]MCG4456775.1 zinc ABC transporter substrate-binding protein [Erysipelothrix rhusiopathiae]MDE8032520.1 zinc ABC transporter substrate-binding protein [Erysipelothrix rhusiopathiae]MDE8036057.1 zinc ABC transporter substrate-binding protein [Erysipelothrix rhusiopathiae]MDE8043330.1 zinc ABC transporter substrate-binding protei
MKRLMSKLLVLVIILGTLSGCVPRSRNVIVTNYPIQFLVERLAGERVNVQRIDSGLIPQQATVKEDFQEIIKKADTIFYINELQPYWQLYLDDLQNSKLQMIDLSERSMLYPFKRYTNVVVDGQSHAIESEYYESDAFAAVDQYDKDPFLWMDPLAMTSMARTIKDWLVQTYPDEEAYFTEQFERLEVELTGLQAQYQLLRDSEKGIKFVSMTPSFGNWQKSYNIGVYPATLSKYGVLPDEDMLNAIRARIAKDGVQFIAYEENMPEEYVKLFNQLKTEFNLTQIELSNLYNLSDKDIEANYDYIAKMRLNLETLETIAK